MPADLLDRLDAWKRRYGDPNPAELAALLDAVAAHHFTGPAQVIRLHETLLFLRAYPHTPEIARKAGELLRTFSPRITGDPAAYEEPEVSGIAGASFSAVFSYEVARSLAARYPSAIDISWDRYENPDLLGHALSRAIPMLREEWPVEAHVPFERYIRAVRKPRQTSLQWLLATVKDPAAYDALQLPLYWKLGNSPAARTHTRLPNKRLFCHPEPLIRRADVSLTSELAGPPLPIRRLSRAEAIPILDLILDTSAVRYRELYGFSHPDSARVYHADAGRGVEIVFFGVAPKWRLPLRTYSAGMFFKNGVPAGYIEVLALFERAEVGFNLYYTFREGESAWIYARLLKLYQQTLGINTFAVDPYQIGHENEEAIESGAFWFYRKLGFRPVDPTIARLAAREEQRICARPGYRSSGRVLRQLAADYIVFEGPGAGPGAWDRFRIRDAALALARKNPPAALRRAAILSVGSH
jgi:hypothetical protein